MELRRDPAVFFAAGGPLSRLLPSFEPRPQQGHLAAAVLDTFASGGTLLAEAGTGVGKSLAYLLPALLWATRPGELPPEERRVVVSTHTRALQEQLWRNDLPLLERALAACGVPFRSAILMGNENYLCVQRLEEARLQGGLPGDPGGKTLAELARHAANAATGLRSAVPFAVSDALWSRVRRDREICLGPRGPFWETCLYRRDLKAARDAHLLVVNHALFFLDLAVGGRVLPPHGAVVLDEAHRVEEAALSQLGLSVSDRSLAALAEEILPGAAGGRRRRGGGERRDPAAPPASRAVEAAARRLGRESAAFFEAARAAAWRLARDHPGRDAPEGDAGTVRHVRVRDAGLLENRLEEPLAELRQALLREAGGGDPARAPALTALAARADDLRDRVATFVTQRMPDAVYWLEAAARRPRGAALHVAPIEVGAFLRQRLFDGRRRVVLTSATLQAAGSFAHVRARLGIPAARELLLGSPFDYRRQALLYIPRDLPDPGTGAGVWGDAVARRVADLLLASDGGAFVLFTSYALLGRVHAALSSDPRLAGLRILRQEPGGGAAATLEAFRATRRGVLLGTMTFWQGVDVQGDALRSVILTRLPFEVPDQPLPEARAERIRSRGGDPFREESLPEAILTFRQGFGRLIRSREDRGLVALLDPRLLTRPYGAAFLESLPRCGRAETLEEIRSFFAGR